MIRFYQRHLSRRKPYPTCRFTPTCSSYALEAFEKRGFFVGFALTVWRILRCSPMSPGGYDPVPEKGFHTMPFSHRAYRKRLEKERQEANRAPDSPSENDSDTPPSP